LEDVFVVETTLYCSHCCGWRIVMRIRRTAAPIHPGEVLREDVLPALGLSVAAAAKNLGVTRQTLHRIIAAAQPAPRNARDGGADRQAARGNGPRLWLNLQTAYDLWHAERRVDTRAIRTLHAAE